MTETSQFVSIHRSRRLARAFGVLVLGWLILCQSPAFTQSHPTVALASENPVAMNVTEDVARLRPAAPRVQESQAASARPGLSEPRALLILAIGFFGIGALASRRRAESQ